MGMAAFNRARRVAAEKVEVQEKAVEEVKEEPNKPRSRTKAKEGEANAQADE